MKLRKRFEPIFSFLILFFGSCNKQNFTEFNQLGELRVLTIQALSDQSEVNPGTSVTLKPVVSDLNGGGRTLDVTIQTCIDPGVDLGKKPQCTVPDSTISSSFSTTTLGANNTYTGDAPSFTVNIPSAPLNYIIAPLYVQYNGVSYLVIYTLKASDGTSVTAFKRIRISSPSKVTKNRNPAFSSISSNGNILNTNNIYNQNILELAPTFSVGPEGRQIMNADGSLRTDTDSILTTWFISDGKIKYQRTVNTDLNQWDLSDSKKPQNRGVVLVVVAHDGYEGQICSIFNFN